MKRTGILVVLIILSVALIAGPRDRAEVERELAFINYILETQGSWQADMNPVTMKNAEEMQSMMGLIPPKEEAREEYVFDARQWPSKGKVVRVNGVSSVKNQAQCGSCVSFGTTAAFEQTYAKKYGVSKDFSERYLFFCQPYTGYGCNGGWSLDGGMVAASNSRKGMIEDRGCPYTSYDCGSSCKTGAQKHTMSYERVSASRYIDVINSGRVVVIGMILYNDFRYYKSGVYEHLSGQRLGGHCMALVGYGTDTSGKHYWLVKNSWASSWGDNGYIKIMVKGEQKYGDSNIEDFGGYAFK